MSKKKTYTSKSKTKTVEEPAVAYQKNKIQFFSSFEEMNDADAKEVAAVDPLENLKNATAYIMHLYADELKNKMTDLNIHIKKNGRSNS